ncbi:MAG: DNA recombination protein RmuC, partial [Bdellovibrionales bacterium]|nr:DNA recombination protein RmuC [Bdellovibrionales bacterium]
ARSSVSHFHQSAKEEFQHREDRIGALVKPLQDSLQKIQTHVHEVEKNREGAYRGLLAQVQMLSETQGKLETETSKLVRSLRTPSVRGRWGEVQLRRVVELAGMSEHTDFSTQVVADANDSSGRIRPDLIVRLPGEKIVVVDAKTPIEAYLDAVQAPSDEERERQYDRHLRHIRTHISQLGAKAYWKQFDQTPEFVVLFLPGECFFSVAVERDPGLIEFGMENNVVVATPTTLIALLRSVAYGWDQVKLTEHAKEVRRIGRELFDRISMFGSHLGDLRKNLIRTVESYNKSMGSLESRIFVSARRLGELVSKESTGVDPIDPIDTLPRISQLAIDDPSAEDEQIAS